MKLDKATIDSMLEDMVLDIYKYGLNKKDYPNSELIKLYLKGKSKGIKSLLLEVVGEMEEVGDTPEQAKMVEDTCEQGGNRLVWGIMDYAKNQLRKEILEKVRGL